MTHLLQAVRSAIGGPRWRGGLRGELLLAIPPTLVTLLSVFLVEALRDERILFASLASSAFLIYRDPAHPMNGVRVMVVAHLVGVGFGVAAATALGAGYTAGAMAMVTTILVLVVLGAVHPPAVSTALGFAFNQQQSNAATLFLFALALVAAIVVMQRVATWTIVRLERQASLAQSEGRS